LAVDRDVAADLNAPVGTTLSQNVGLGLFGPRRLLFLPMSWFLTVLMWERHHAVRSLYDDHAIPLFPDLMPPSAPPLNPYP
jgi:hypothetical protein